MTENKKFAEIETLISQNPVVLFMKGTKAQPMCGFSAMVVDVLGRIGVDFVDVNIMADQEMRQAIKDYTDWPTIPQLYVGAEFIGGCDIVKEMYQSGELLQLFKDKNISASAA